jgi:ABC-type antimicrobial peptide transport system permease subunit
MYSPLVVGDSQAVLHIRTDIAPPALIRPVREILRKLAPELPIYEIATIDQDIEDSLAGEKLVADLAISFSFLAVLIVAVGLFGLLSFVVTQRTREIGIRIAVGAQPLNVFKLISAQTLLLAGAGMGIGLLGSYFAGRALASLLYEVSARDPSVWSVAAVVILTITVLATAVPTIRALRIQPATALREDG